MTNHSRSPTHFLLSFALRQSFAPFAAFARKRFELMSREGYEGIEEAGHRRPEFRHSRAYFCPTKTLNFITWLTSAAEVAATFPVSNSMSESRNISSSRSAFNR